MKTNEELEKMSIDDLEKESLDHFSYVSKIDTLVKYKKRFQK